MVDLTVYIPSELRSIFLGNLLKLSIIEKGLTFNLELNAKEKQKINSILSRTGYIVSELFKIPESVLMGVKFSQVLTKPLSKIFRIKIPAVLSKAFRRAHIETKFVWNFLISLRTGMSKYCFLGSIRKNELIGSFLLSQSNELINNPKCSQPITLQS